MTRHGRSLREVISFLPFTVREVRTLCNDHFRNQPRFIHASLVSSVWIRSISNNGESQSSTSNRTSKETVPRPRAGWTNTWLQTRGVVSPDGETATGWSVSASKSLRLKNQLGTPLVGMRQVHKLLRLSNEKRRPSVKILNARDPSNNPAHSLVCLATQSMSESEEPPTTACESRKTANNDKGEGQRR
jgi:hypothetical protein